jgi:hypothetical protein
MNTTISNRQPLGGAQATQGARDVQGSSGADAAKGLLLSTRSMIRVADTFPPPPTTHASGAQDAQNAQAPTGVDSTAQGMERATLANVNVARRTFWGKFLTSAMVAAGLVMMTVASGGLGTAALVAIGCSSAYLAKSSLDTVLSFANWRNTKAELEGRDLPWPALRSLPPSVRARGDALAALLVASGRSEKTALRVSTATEVVLGLLAAGTGGYAAKGGLGVAAALLPLLLGTGIQAASARLTQRRQQHVQETADRVRGQLDQARQELDQFNTRCLNKLNTLILREQDPELQANLKALRAQAHEFMEEAEAELDKGETEHVLRLELKAERSIDGAGAVVSDVMTNQVALMADKLPVTPLPILMVGTKAVRSLVEWGRTERSERRDQAKEAKFNEVLLDLKARTQDYGKRLQQQIQDLTRPPDPPPFRGQYA